MSNNIVYYVLDTETTGLKVGWHEINQISILSAEPREKIIGQPPQEFFEPKVSEAQLSLDIAVQNPGRASYEALKIQGITHNDLRKGISKEEAVKEAHEFLTADGLTPEHRCIVGHNIAFDRKFVFKLWEDCGLVFPAFLWLCTNSMAKGFVKTSGMKDTIAQNQGEEKVRYGLNVFMEGIGLTPKRGAHSAEVDVQNTTTLFNWLKHEDADYIPKIKRVPQVEPKKQEEWEMDYD